MKRREASAPLSETILRIVHEHVAGRKLLYYSERARRANMGASNGSAYPKHLRPGARCGAGV